MLYYQHPIVEKLGELITDLVVDHGEIDGVEWAVTRYDKSASGDIARYGQFNGYVLIPKGHPWHGTQTNDFGLDGGPVSHVHVHGGITFNHENVWGFDTGHAVDGAGEQYLWDQYSVCDEVKDLARQVAQNAEL